ncbi:Arc family DNA-binding protein [bacterium]|nr:Arc family DNA-binding protein [bacterium]
MASKKYENEKVFTLRINKDIFEKVKSAAEADKRSISKEIEYILFSALNKKDQ